MAPPVSNVCTSDKLARSVRFKMSRHGRTLPLGPLAMPICEEFCVLIVGTPTANHRRMTRALLSAAIDSDWKLVSQGRPCPVCGAEDTCGVHVVDEFACCARAPSEWKLTN